MSQPGKGSVGTSTWHCSCRNVQPMQHGRKTVEQKHSERAKTLCFSKTKLAAKNQGLENCQPYGVPMALKPWLNYELYTSECIIPLGSKIAH